MKKLSYRLYPTLKKNEAEPNVAGTNKWNALKRTKKVIDVESVLHRDIANITEESIDVKSAEEPRYVSIV